jgi:hypothetical protein
LAYLTGAELTAAEPRREVWDNGRLVALPHG